MKKILLLFSLILLYNLYSLSVGNTKEVSCFYEQYKEALIPLAEKKDFRAIDRLTLSFFKPNGPLSRRDMLRRYSMRNVPKNALAHLDLSGRIREVLKEAQLQVGIPEDDLADARNLLSNHDDKIETGVQWEGGISMDQDLLDSHSESFTYFIALHESTHYLYMDFLVGGIVYSSLGERVFADLSCYYERRSDINALETICCYRCLEEIYDQRRDRSFPKCYIQNKELLKFMREFKAEGGICVKHVMSALQGGHPEIVEVDQEVTEGPQ